MFPLKHLQSNEINNQDNYQVNLDQEAYRGLLHKADVKASRIAKNFNFQSTETCLSANSPFNSQVKNEISRYYNVETLSKISDSRLTSLQKIEQAQKFKEIMHNVVIQVEEKLRTKSSWLSTFSFISSYPQENSIYSELNEIINKNKTAVQQKLQEIESSYFQIPLDNLLSNVSSFKDNFNVKIKLLNNADASNIVSHLKEINLMFNELEELKEFCKNYPENGANISSYASGQREKFVKTLEELTNFIQAKTQSALSFDADHNNQKIVTSLGRYQFDSEQSFSNCLIQFNQLATHVHDLQHSFEFFENDGWNVVQFSDDN